MKPALSKNYISKDPRYHDYPSAGKWTELLIPRNCRNIATTHYDVMFSVPLSNKETALIEGRQGEKAKARESMYNGPCAKKVPSMAHCPCKIASKKPRWT